MHENVCRKRKMIIMVYLEIIKIFLHQIVVFRKKLYFNDCFVPYNFVNLQL